MYVAVIAESVADRKHLERLLDRVSDSIMDTAGNLYIESFGDASSLRAVIQKYNIFFLDFETDADAMGEVIDILLELSVPLNKVVICQSEEAARNYEDEACEFQTVQKPLNPKQLASVVLNVYQAEQAAKVPTLEIRCEDQTRYVPIADIVYAQAEAYQVRISLVDGKELFMMGGIEDFARDVEFCGDFITYKKGFSYNRAFEKSKSPTLITLTTGKTFTLSRFDKKLPY